MKIVTTIYNGEEFAKYFYYKVSQDQWDWESLEEFYEYYLQLIYDEVDELMIYDMLKYSYTVYFDGDHKDKLDINDLIMDWDLTNIEDIDIERFKNDIEYRRDVVFDMDSNATVTTSGNVIVEK